MKSLPLVTILIPVYNEEEILRSSTIKVHTHLEEKGINHEIIVVSNGSTDETEIIGRELEREFPWLRLLTLPEKGVGTAFTNGVLAARGEYLISLDADLSFEMQFIDYAIDLLSYSDMVVGSKTMGEQRRSFLRVIASQLYILCTQLLFNITVSDYSIGCKAYRRSVLLPIIQKIDGWTGYVMELCLYMKQHEHKVIQIGVTCDDHRASHFNLIHEGIFRYRHLYRCWKKLKKGDAWFCAKQSSNVSRSLSKNS